MLFQVSKKKKHKNSYANKFALPEKLNSDANYIISLSIIFFAAILLHFIFVFILKNNEEGYHFLNRNWGFNNISYFFTPFVILFYLLAILISFKKSTEAFPEFFANISSIGISEYFRKHKLLFFILISGICTSFFFAFKIKYALLGDMDMRVDQAMKKIFVREDYGAMVIFYYFHHFLNSLWLVSPKQAISALSALAGFPFIFLSLLTADQLGKNLFQKTAISLFSTAIGATQFFFGYLEVYALPATLFALYLYTCILCLKNKAHIIVPFIVLVTIIWMHFLGIGLAPSFFVLAYKKFLYKLPFFNRITTKSFIIFIIFCLPLPFIIGRIIGIRGFMLPITIHDKRYPEQMTLFSPVHIWELINSQLLASGTGFFMLLFITYKALKKEIKFDSILWFLASASFFTLFILFVADNLRGSGDWDIMSFPALIFSPMVIYCLIYNFSNTHNSILRYAISVLVVFNLLNLVTWVGINATDKSTKKIADMIEFDPGTYYLQQIPADVILGMTLAGIGDFQASQSFFNKLFAQKIVDAKTYFNYSLTLFQEGDTASGNFILNECIEQVPYYSLPYFPLLNYYIEHKNWNSYISLMCRMLNAYTEQPTNFDKQIGIG